MMITGKWEIYSSTEAPSSLVNHVEMYHPTNSVLSAITLHYETPFFLGLGHDYSLTLSLRSSLFTEAMTAFAEALKAFKTILNPHSHFGRVIHQFYGSHSRVHSEITMRILDKKDLIQARRLLETLAEQNPTEEILSALPHIFEIADTIFHKQLLDEEKYAFHKIPTTLPIGAAHINPDRENNKELIHFVEDFLGRSCKEKQEQMEEFILNQITEYLSIGDNPYQTSLDESYTIAHAAMLHGKNQKLIILILLRLAQYGFNLRYKTESKRCVFHYSPIELAYREKKLEVVNFISYATTCKIRQPRDPWHQLGVPMRADDKVVTFFKTKHNRLFMSKLSLISSLKLTELMECLTLFATMYRSNHLPKIMLQDFKPSNFIETIFVEGNELAGMNVYEIFDHINDEYPNHILINHPHELLIQYQGLGITKKINERLPLALKALYHDQTIVVYYSGLTYGSVKSRTQFLEGPKYQGKDFARFLNAIFSRVYDQYPNLHIKGIQCSINEVALEVRNKSASSSEQASFDLFKQLALYQQKKDVPELDIFYPLYLAMLMHAPCAPKDHMKSIPKVWIMEPANYCILQKQSKEHPITFRRNNIDFAKVITPLMEKPIKKKAYNPSHFFPGITQLGKNLFDSKTVTLNSPITSRV